VIKLTKEDQCPVKQRKNPRVTGGYPAIRVKQPTIGP
jgi:hypothetical protein